MTSKQQDKDIHQHDIHQKKGFSSEEINAMSQSVLNEKLDNIDVATLSRLHQARQQAVDAAVLRPSFLQRYWPDRCNLRRSGHPILQALALVGLIVFALGTGYLMSHTRTDQLNLGQGEYLANEDDLEVAEDLDFIAWLIEQDKVSDNHAG